MVSSTERFFSTVSCVRQNFERLKRCNAQLARYDLLTSKEQVDETLEHSSFICSSVSAQISDLKAILKACSRDDLRACARHFELVTQQFSEINRSRLNIIHNLDQEEARSQKRITNFEDENRTGEALQDESIQKSVSFRGHSPQSHGLSALGTNLQCSSTDKGYNERGRTYRI